MDSESRIYGIYTPFSFGRDELEETGQVILPESYLKNLINTRYSNVYTFCILNERIGESVYAGVQEFTADEGKIIAPWWMMSKIGANEGDQVIVKAVDLPPATRAIFQPLSEDFEKIPKPKVVLEKALRSHPCLTQGSIIPISFANNTYRIRILKTEPLQHVSIRKADIECEIAPVESKFEHKWNEPDTDSSEDEDSDGPKHIAHQIKGAKIIRLNKHSTMASREQDLNSKRQFVGVRTYIDGKEEILPPKPKEKKQKKQEFIGQWHNLRKESGVVAPKVRDYGAQFDDNPEESENKSPFIGTPRKIEKQ